MSHTWALQDAKNHFSEVVERALHEGPQLVTRHRRDAVVVLSVGEYRRVTAAGKGDLVTFLQKSPLAGAGLKLERSGDTGRDVEL